MRAPAGAGLAVYDLLGADGQELLISGFYARRFDLRLRAPDALHLVIARRLDATLVTLDRRLATAARDMGIAVEMPKAS